MVEPWPSRPLPSPPPDLCDGLILRPPRSSDASAFAAAWADETIARWLDPPTADIATAEAWIAGEPRRRAVALALDLAIERDGVVVGEIGFSSFDASRRACLVGYWLSSSARGLGIATGALQTATRWLRRELGPLTVLAECHPDNTASHRVAESAGYQLLAADHGGRRVYVHRG